MSAAQRLPPSVVRSVLAILLACVTMPPHGEQDGAPAPPCDERASRLARGLGEAIRYKPREQRCEGVYREEYATAANPDLAVLAVYETFDAFPRIGEAPLEVRWPSMAGSTDGLVRLRAGSKRPGLHYQMDAAASMNASFLWPRDVLNAVDVDAEELVLLGWYEASVGDELLRVHLPLRVRVANEEREGSASDDSAPPAPRRDPSDPDADARADRAPDVDDHDEGAQPARDIAPITLVIEVRALEGIQSASVSKARLTDQGEAVYYRRGEPILQSGFGSGGSSRYEIELEPPWGVQMLELGVVYRTRPPATARIYCAASPHERDGR